MDHVKSQDTVTSVEADGTHVITVPFPESYVYANASAFAMTMMDLKIGFAEAMPDKKIQSRLGVTVPIEHAAHLAIQLFAQLVSYERNWGAIRHPQWADFKDRVMTSQSGGTAEQPQRED
jgi:hypothetical protein